MNGEEERERERWRQKRTSFVNLVVAIEFPCCPRSDISQDPLSLSRPCVPLTVSESHFVRAIIR